MERNETPKGARAASRALKAVGAEVECIEFSGCNHGCLIAPASLSFHE
ncbi:hypothetical protein [Bacteroides timonensis]|nr:hypothetical protein [Bacteroides timonensis]